MFDKHLVAIMPQNSGGGTHHHHHTHKEPPAADSVRLADEMRQEVESAVAKNWANRSHIELAVHGNKLNLQVMEAYRAYTAAPRETVICYVLNNQPGSFHYANAFHGTPEDMAKGFFDHLAKEIAAQLLSSLPVDSESHKHLMSAINLTQDRR